MAVSIVIHLTIALIAFKLCGQTQVVVHFARHLAWIVMVQQAVSHALRDIIYPAQTAYHAQ